MDSDFIEKVTALANSGQKEISRLKEDVKFYNQVMTWTENNTIFQCPKDYKHLLNRGKFVFFSECGDSCNLEGLCRVAYKDAYHFFQESQAELQ